MERLQKALARAGVASRRKAEALIADGRVRVNGSVVAELGAQVDTATDIIEVNGRRIAFNAPPVYLMLNKPSGCVTTRSDPQQRATILDLLPQKFRHLHPVGRLDADTEGLLLLTNDGGFTHRLTHPRHEVTKTYRAVVKGEVTPSSLTRLAHGLVLDDGPTAPCRARLVKRGRDRSEVEVEIHEGRKRQVRRMLAAMGHPVLALRRTRVGDLALGRLPRGAFRRLTTQEVARLRG